MGFISACIFKFEKHSRELFLIPICQLLSCCSFTVPGVFPGQWSQRHHAQSQPNPPILSIAGSSMPAIWCGASNDVSFSLHLLQQIAIRQEAAVPANVVHGPWGSPIKSVNHLHQSLKEGAMFVLNRREWNGPIHCRCRASSSNR